MHTTKEIKGLTYKKKRDIYVSFTPMTFITHCHIFISLQTVLVSLHPHFFCSLNFSPLSFLGSHEHHPVMAFFLYLLTLFSYISLHFLHLVLLQSYGQTTLIYSFISFSSHSFLTLSLLIASNTLRIASNLLACFSWHTQLSLP